MNVDNGDTAVTVKKNKPGLSCAKLRLSWARLKQGFATNLDYKNLFGVIQVMVRQIFWSI